MLFVLIALAISEEVEDGPNAEAERQEEAPDPDRPEMDADDADKEKDTDDTPDHKEPKQNSLNDHPVLDDIDQPGEQKPKIAQAPAKVIHNNDEQEDEEEADDNSVDGSKNEQKKQDQDSTLQKATATIASQASKAISPVMIVSVGGLLIAAIAVGVKYMMKSGISKPSSTIPALLRDSAGGTTPNQLGQQSTATMRAF